MAKARCSCSKQITGFQYRKLADEIEQEVVQGSYRAGDKLPSLREAHSRTGLSITTVLRAYQELEDRGVIEPREKSGFFVKPHIRNILPLPGFVRHKPEARSVEVNALVDAITEILGDPLILPLGAAIPASELLPVRQLAAYAKSAARIYSQHAGIGYGPPDGTPALRRQIAKRSLEFEGMAHPDDIVITSGCMDAIQLCLRAVADPGDTILVESPTYTGYLQLIEDLKMLALEVPADPESGIDLPSLEKTLETHNVKACILNSNFQNPLGYEMSEASKQQIVELTAKRGITIIEDDIYGELYFGTARPRPLKSFDRKGMVLYCSSFSKSLAPDLRVGWTMPGRFIDRVRRLRFNTSIALPKLNQVIIADYLEGNSYDRHLRKLRGALKSQTLNTALAIARYFPASARISAPKGGIILWVQLEVDGMEVFHEARRHKIFVLPGIISSGTDEYKNCIRISCGNPWSERIEKGIQTLGQIVSRIAS